MTSPYDITKHVDYPKLKNEIDTCTSQLHNYMEKTKVEQLLNNIKTNNT